MRSPIHPFLPPPLVLLLLLLLPAAYAAPEGENLTVAGLEPELPAALEWEPEASNEAAPSAGIGAPGDGGAAPFLMPTAAEATKAATGALEETLALDLDSALDLLDLSGGGLWPLELLGGSSPDATLEPPLLPRPLPHYLHGAQGNDPDHLDRPDDDLMDKLEPRGPAAPEAGSFETLGAAPPLILHDVPVSTLAAPGVAMLLAVLARLYSRFEKHELLRNEARARIHTLVTERPDSTYADLAKATGLGRGALVHHCQMLERQGLLVSRHDGLNRRFSAGGCKLPSAARPPTESERRVLDLLAQQGPLTQGEMATRLDVTPQAVSYHVLRLQRSGRLQPLEADGRRLYVVPRGSALRDEPAPSP